MTNEDMTTQKLIVRNFFIANPVIKTMVFALYGELKGSQSFVALDKDSKYLQGIVHGCDKAMQFTCMAIGLPDYEIIIEMFDNGELKDLFN